MRPAIKGRQVVCSADGIGGDGCPHRYESAGMCSHPDCESRQDPYCPCPPFYQHALRLQSAALARVRVRAKDNIANLEAALRYFGPHNEGGVIDEVRNSLVAYRGILRALEGE